MQFTITGKLFIVFYQRSNNFGASFALNLISLLDKGWAFRDAFKMILIKIIRGCDWPKYDLDDI